MLFNSTLLSGLTLSSFLVHSPLISESSNYIKKSLYLHNFHVQNSITHLLYMQSQLSYLSIYNSEFDSFLKRPLTLSNEGCWISANQEFRGTHFEPPCINLSYCTFSNCSSDGEGGAFLINTNTPSVNLVLQCQFIRCSAQFKGGALSITFSGSTESSQLLIYSSVFENCHLGAVDQQSDSLGGAIYCHVGTFSVINSTFTNDTIEEALLHTNLARKCFGGAIYAKVHVFDKIAYSKFENCAAPSPTPMPTNTLSFTSTRDFTLSAIFSETEEFTVSLSFSDSLAFSDSDTFLPSDSFSNSALFTETEDFSKTESFSISSLFSNSGSFSTSNSFSKSVEFSLSEIFSSTEGFSETESFTKTTEFSDSISFTVSSIFSDSSYFSNSVLFSNSISFSDSEKFTESTSFSESTRFTLSDKFSSSISFSESTIFSKSGRFSFSEKFSSSISFSESYDFSPSQSPPPSPSQSTADGISVAPNAQLLFDDFDFSSERNVLVNNELDSNSSGGAVYVKFITSNSNLPQPLDILGSNFTGCFANSGSSLFFNTPVSINITSSRFSNYPENALSVIRVDGNSENELMIESIGIEPRTENCKTHIISHKGTMKNLNQEKGKQGTTFFNDKYNPSEPIVYPPISGKNYYYLRYPVGNMGYSELTADQDVMDILIPPSLETPTTPANNPTSDPVTSENPDIPAESLSISDSTSEGGGADSAVTETNGGLSTVAIVFIVLACILLLIGIIVCLILLLRHKCSCCGGYDILPAAHGGLTYF